jgi:multiple sugar transport system permease protein
LRESKLKWILILPSIVILLGVGLAPFVYAVALSFYKWPPYPTLPVTWNGIANYIAMLSDSEFWNALSVILKFMVVSLPVEFLLGMIVALVFADFRARLRNAISSFVLIPTMLAPIAVGATWFLMFTGVGPVNYVLSSLGFGEVGWLSDPNYALLTIIIADIWEWTPFVAIVLLSGLLALPLEPFESARVDGASEWQIFRSITLPLLRPIVFVVLILRTTDAIKMFDIPFVLTQGGPGDLTESISLYIYRVGLYFFDPSYAACLTMAVMVIVTIIITLYMRFIYRGASFGGE